MPTERYTGVVAKWLNHKGIGFITPDENEDNTGDILVHFKQIKQESDDGFVSLEQGSKVEFELEADPKDGSKQVAVNVTGIDGEDCSAKKKGSSKGKGKGKGKKGKGKGKGRKGKGKGKKSDEDADEE